MTHYEKRGYVKTYDEEGKLISKVPAQEEELDEMVETGDE